MVAMLDKNTVIGVALFGGNFRFMFLKKIRGRLVTTSSDGKLWGPSLERLFLSNSDISLGDRHRTAFILGPFLILIILKIAEIFYRYRV